MKGCTRIVRVTFLEGLLERSVLGTIRAERLSVGRSARETLRGSLSCRDRWLDIQLERNSPLAGVACAESARWGCSSVGQCGHSLDPHFAASHYLIRVTCPT